MTEITKKLLEKELKGYKLLQRQKSSTYYDGKISAIRRLLKILEKGYIEKKDKTCPFIKIGDYDWGQNICGEEHCQCWSTKRNDCGLKLEIK